MHEIHSPQRIPLIPTLLILKTDIQDLDVDLCLALLEGGDLLGAGCGGGEPV